ncbi:hypothetical protein [Caballeronia sp. Sq4a]|uniref:hypothetical protein n=1 Tax=Caballeronia sp. Sq4a TaxID=2878152 RepID=UPI0020C0A015|nr:hypothetical protein [Caballeronia sp. Sq4a]
MKNKKAKPVLSVDEAQALIAMEKSTVRPMEWVAKKQVSNPQWVQYVSACRIATADGGSEIREDLFFLTQFRARKIEIVGGATIEYEEQYNAAFMVGGERILAVDADSTPHTNKVGRGLPWYKKRVPGRYHLHIWTEDGYGYTEPIFQELDDIELAISHFLPLANLNLLGGFVHPLKGSQMDLLL